MIVGVLLITFITLAPNGIVGLFDRYRQKRQRRLSP